MQTMLADGYSIEEVDKMTGVAVGRPKTATFRTFDLVGLDILAHVASLLNVSTDNGSRPSAGASAPNTPAVIAVRARGQIALARTPLLAIARAVETVSAAMPALAAP